MEICFLWGEIKKKGERGGEKEKKKKKRGKKREGKGGRGGRHTFGYAIATSKIVFAKKSGFMRSYILKVIDTGTAIRVTHVSFIKFHENS